MPMKLVSLFLMVILRRHGYDLKIKIINNCWFTVVPFPGVKSSFSGIKWLNSRNGC
jgi:hypothetical protein